MLLTRLQAPVHRPNLLCPRAVAAGQFFFQFFWVFSAVVVGSHECARPLNAVGAPAPNRTGFSRCGSRVLRRAAFCRP